MADEDEEAPPAPRRALPDAQPGMPAVRKPDTPMPEVAQAVIADGKIDRLELPPAPAEPDVDTPSELAELPPFLQTLMIRNEEESNG